jgi:hypothetical protein
LLASGKDANVFEIEVKDWRWHLPPLRDGQVEASARVAVAPSGRLVVHQLALNRRRRCRKRSGGPVHNCPGVCPSTPKSRENGSLDGERPA